MVQEEARSKEARSSCRNTRVDLFSALGVKHRRKRGTSSCIPPQVSETSTAKPAVGTRGAFSTNVDVEMYGTDATYTELIRRDTLEKGRIRPIKLKKTKLARKAKKVSKRRANPIGLIC